VSFEIRPARPSDAEQIHRFISELAEFEKLAHEVVATPDDLRSQLFPATGVPAARCVIGWLDDKPLGFALFFYTFSTFLGRKGIHLEDLYISPAHRGAGYGKALLLHLAKIAHDENCGRLEWAVLDWNQSAIDFYESLGAVRLNDWTTCRLDHETIVRLAT
jgi:GNAT superfamily N-acetyltransferase